MGLLLGPDSPGDRPGQGTSVNVYAWSFVVILVVWLGGFIWYGGRPWFRRSESTKDKRH